MSSELPEILSVPVFLLTLPFLLLFGHLGRGVKLGNGSRRSVRTTVLTIGLTYIGLQFVLLLNITEADGAFIAWLFAWFCAHGIPALMIARNCLTLLKR